MPSEKNRCPWCLSHPLYVEYHDEEWGIPKHDDHYLFEKLILEGFQAGLSWFTILQRRPHFRVAFDHFDASKMADYDEAKKAALLQNPGIIRNRLKVEAAVINARAILQTREKFGTFDQYIWQFTDGKTIVNHYSEMRQIPANTVLSDRISKDLKNRGFKFVGSTTIYAYLQSIGVVDDHLVSCWKRQVNGL